MSKINRLQQSVDEHFEKYPRYVDNHIWELIKSMRQGKDAQDRYEHEREGDFLRGYEAAVKTVVDIIKYNAEHWPHEISKEWAGRMIVGMLRKMHTDDYFINSELYDEFDKYANIDYKPKHKQYDMFVSPYNETDYYIIIGTNNETKEYNYLVVHDHLGGKIECKQMGFKKFDDMIDTNYINCTCGGL